MPPEAHQPRGRPETPSTLCCVCCVAALPEERCRTSSPRGRACTPPSVSSDGPVSGRPCVGSIACGSGLPPDPHAAIIDSPSAKTPESGGPRGFDGHQNVNGRKRHALVDPLNLLPGVVMPPANLHDRVGGRRLVAAVKGQWPTLEKERADQGYAGQEGRRASQELDLNLEVGDPWRPWSRCMPQWVEAQGVDGSAFHGVPGRWVVERTAWMGRNRRPSRAFETLPETEAVWCSLAMCRLLLRRLTTC
ncbi:transposase [Deinococcus koreensis]|uniref:Transposase IS4-like domain-containing protein n=1 Tax=Deinococcus koreensis TaxID=2054903 RepID=A0A2K3URY2_9DEIO|nr:hypothetical protein CVO96_20320 [Deinococcus koreensis]